MCDFVCGAISHAKSLLHWSVIHYQVTFGWHSGWFGNVYYHTWAALITHIPGTLFQNIIGRMNICLFELMLNIPFNNFSVTLECFLVLNYMGKSLGSFLNSGFWGWLSTGSQPQMLNLGDQNSFWFIFSLSKDIWPFKLEIVNIEWAYCKFLEWGFESSGFWKFWAFTHVIRSE